VVWTQRKSPEFGRKFTALFQAVVASAGSGNYQEIIVSTRAETRESSENHRFNAYGSADSVGGVNLERVLEFTNNVPEYHQTEHTDKAPMSIGRSGSDSCRRQLFPNWFAQKGNPTNNDTDSEIRSLPPDS
jgi:hypothetical protein